MNPIRAHKLKEQVIDLYLRGVGICVGDVYGERLEAVEYLQEAQSIAKTLGIEVDPISTQHQLVRRILDMLDHIDSNPFAPDNEERVLDIYHTAKGYRSGNP